MNGPLDSHFNLGRYWDQADGISHAVAYVLLAMSLVSWFVILSKAYSLWRVRRAAPAVDAFWAAPNSDDGIALLRAADREDVFSPLPVLAVQELNAPSNFDRVFTLASGPPSPTFPAVPSSGRFAPATWI